MVIDFTFDIQIIPKNKKHYNKKGYKCNVGDIINVPWTDVPSYYNISCQCDRCLLPYTSKKSTLITQKHSGLCKKCTSVASHDVEDLTGKQFGRLTVISIHKREYSKETYWKCLCSCGNKKIVSARSLRSNKTTSCGCYHKEIIQSIIIPKLIEKNKKQIGELHPNWDPTKSNKERFTLRKYEMSVLRKETFERDNYTCQCCLKRDGSILNAHHILPFSKHVDLRYDVNNLITLCYTCHKSYHAKYKKDINKETLEEFRKEVNFVV